MMLKFTKMHGIGNDFVVVDGVSQFIRLTPRHIRKLADRHKGVGCDQILMVLPPDKPEHDFKYVIYNGDGSRAGQCGNGARCFARFVHDHKLTYKRDLLIEVGDRIISMHYHSNNEIEVNMGRPDLTPESIPLDSEQCTPEHNGLWKLTSADTDALAAVRFFPVSMGNPHAVLIVDDVDQAPVDTLGPALEQHPAFKDKANIGFLELSDRNNGKLRVYERGAGETLACGSGACAAMVAAYEQGKIDTKINLELRGGKLEISRSDEGEIWMKGPASRSFEGTILL